MPHVILQSALGSFYVESASSRRLQQKKISKSNMFGLLGEEQTILQDFEWDNAFGWSRWYLCPKSSLKAQMVCPLKKRLPLVFNHFQAKNKK